MNKRILTILLSIIASVLLIGSLPVRSAAADSSSYKIVIDDQADLLTDAEEQKLRSDMAPITEFGNVGFVTINENAYDSTYSFAKAYYVSTFGGGVSGTLFIIDLDEREIYIVSDGAIYRTVTDSRAYTITDNVYTYASRGNYYGCAAEAFAQIQTILSGGKIAEPMKYVSNALLAVAASLLIMYIIVRSMTRVKAASVGELSTAARVSFNGGDTRVVHTGQTRRYDPPASSSGGSGGGGGGGGGFSGGGGGHKF